MDTRSQLILQHYKERIAQLEESLATARADYTMTSTELGEVRGQLEEHLNAQEEHMTQLEEN